MKPNFWIADYRDGAYQLTELRHETNNIKDTTHFTPEGAYTTFRTYERFRVLRLTRHFNRLEETSRLAGHEITLDRPALKAAIIRCIETFDEGETRIRVTIDLSREIGRLYIALESLHVPAPELYQYGIDTLSAEMHRDNPKAKLSNFLSRAESVRAHTAGNYEEILMYDENGNYLEGLSSNFYGVRGGQIFTAEEGVLSGTTRDFVLTLARELDIPVSLTPVNRDTVDTLDEAFITSTSRSILPIRSIDGQTFNAPGPVTARLTQRFNEELESQKESLKD